MSTDKQLMEEDEHPYEKTTFPKHVTDTKNTAVHKAIGMSPQSVLQTVSNWSIAGEVLPTCRNTASTKVQARPSCCSRDTESLKTTYPWRNKGPKRMYRMAFIVVAYTAGILLINGFRTFGSNADGSGEERWKRSNSSDGGPVLLRNKRFPAITKIAKTASGEALRCIPRSVENFPGNFMTHKDTANGGFVIHILIALYVFAAIAIVCDDYFVPSLEHICEDLGLQADVAGATFMAAGSSAPEFMTSVIGVFFAKSDVGVGTIVGSAVFNILFIIGVCGLFAGMVVQLTWYPLVRDTLFYLLSVLALYMTIRDQEVKWFEALIMLLLYMIYILIMYFNRSMEKRARAFVKRMQLKAGRLQQSLRPEDIEPQITEPMMRARAHSRISQTLLLSGSHEGPITSDQRTLSYEQRTLSRQRLTMSQNSQEYRFSTAASDNKSLTSFRRSSSNVDGPVVSELTRTDETIIKETVISEKESSISKAEAPITVSEYQSVWEIPDNFFFRIIWVAMCPVKALFFITVPDSRKLGIWARLYILSFMLSVLWISALTYLMVWMVTIAGDALDIPDTVMGLTLLAAGTSVPDCLASVFVARDGYGDMAVSNSLGSNVFDILMCLGLPWMIECALSAGGSVGIDSGGLTYSTLTLLTTVVFLLVSMGLNKWKLTKLYGCLCLGTYLIVVTLSCLFELNVFGDINPPACER